MRSTTLARTLRAIAVCLAASAAHAQGVDDRVRGMLLGGLVGDAAGGPVEFVEPARLLAAQTPFRVWRQGERIDDLDRYGGGLDLMSYAVFRPEPEPYGQWTANAPPGTLTDDSRLKMITLRAIRAAGGALPLTSADLARAFTAEVERRGGTPSAQLAAEGLREYVSAARWIIGERSAEALPATRLWGGLPTCAGQMTLPPLAALHPGDPAAAYRHAYGAAFLDNGEALDINAALIAGLAAGLTADGTTTERWDAVKHAFRETDPFRYAEVPWVRKPAERWLATGLDAAHRANRSPARLREIIETEIPKQTWWEAGVIFAMAIAAVETAEARPLASVRLAIELGHDTDSTAQLAGLLVGAIHGADAFPERLRVPVERSLREEHGEDLDEWIAALAAARDRLPQE